MTLSQAIEFRNEGFFRKAREILATLVETQPENANLHYQLGITLGRLGDHRGAIASYRTALKLGLPEEDESHAILACATTLRAQRRYFEAARELRRGLERRPDDDGLRTLLALCLHKLGMYDDALHTAMQLLLTTTRSPSINAHAQLIALYVDELIDRDELETA